MEYQLKAKIFSDNGVFEGVLHNYWDSPDLITICIGNVVLTLPIETCTRICVFPEQIKNSVREILEVNRQIPLFEERPAS